MPHGFAEAGAFPLHRVGPELGIAEKDIKQKGRRHDDHRQPKRAIGGDQHNDNANGGGDQIHARWQARAQGDGVLVPDQPHRREYAEGDQGPVVPGDVPPRAALEHRKGKGRHCQAKCQMNHALYVRGDI